LIGISSFLAPSGPAAAVVAGALERLQPVTNKPTTNKHPSERWNGALKVINESSTADKKLNGRGDWSKIFRELQQNLHAFPLKQPLQ
jgi:hypothetical protein